MNKTVIKTNELIIQKLLSKINKLSPIKFGYSQLELPSYVSCTLFCVYPDGFKQNILGVDTQEQAIPYLNGYIVGFKTCKDNFN